MEVTVQELNRVADCGHPTGEVYCHARLILQRAQMDSFHKEYSLLKVG